MASQSTPRRSSRNDQSLLSGDYENAREDPLDVDGDFHLPPWRYSDELEEIPSGEYTKTCAVNYTAGEESVIVRKLDQRLVLFVALLYLLSFLDRSNIGNAKLAGMEDDLNLTETQFHSILDGFYITYILFEFMTICYQLFPAHTYIACCVSFMGAIAALQSLSTGFWSMFFLRLCLGVAEASFGPGIPFYLSLFFKREELARRTGFFIAAAPLANSLAGGMAWLILQFSSRTNIDGWRLLFLVEGFPNIVLAVVAWHVIPDSPETIPWLNPRERNIASMRLQKIQKQHSASRINLRENYRSHLDWAKVSSTLKDPKSYLVAAILFSLNVAFSSLPVFLPTIVENMGFSPLSAQGMSAFPNLVAFGVVIVTASLSDRFESRSVPLMIHALLAMSGYALLAVAPRMPHLLRYLCLFPMMAGFFSAVTMVIVWTVNNQESDEGKAIGSSILQVFGHVGSLFGQQLYPDTSAPYYVTSHAICALSMALAAALTFVLRVLLQSANEKRLIQGMKVGEDDEPFIPISRREFMSNEFMYIL